VSADAFVYDWHRESEGFKKWLLPTLLGDVIRDDSVLELLRERSNGFSAIELRVTVNDYEVDAGRFIDVLESTLEHSAQDAAREHVGRIAELRDLRHAIDEITDRLHEQVSRVAHKHGIELNDRD
jgi:hypothetical protein